MKLFTVEEANALLPTVRRKLERIQKLYARIAELREPAHAAAIASEFGGGMEGGPEYVRALYEVGKITTELHELGDGDEIEWWHEIEAGFAGRQPL